MKVKTNCSIDEGPSGSSAWYITKAVLELGHELVTGYDADLVLNVDGMRPIDRLPGAKYFFWDCDSFWHSDPLIDYDQIFIGGSPEDLFKYRDGTVFLPHAFDPEIHKKHEVEQKYDIVMIGNTDNNLYSKRNELVKELAKHFNVYHNSSAFGEDYAKLMSMGKLIFNHTLTEKNIPMRFFEGMAIGALMENYNFNLDDLAQEGTHYIGYTESDLIEQAKYYLEHDEEREKIAKQGREHALKNHTYKHRVERILSYV